MLKMMLTRNSLLFLLIWCITFQESEGGIIGNSWVSNQSYYWINGRVDYVFENRFDYNYKSYVRDAIEEIKGNLTKDCLEFRELESRPETPPYILFIHAQCRAEIGQQLDEPTKVYIGPECHQTETIIHEIMHALGAVHEHSRPDRDVFVRINPTSIKDGYLSDFEQIASANKTYQTIFDYYSIMMYPKFAHSKNKSSPSMEPLLMLEERVLEEQTSVLSPADVVELSRAYGCRIDAFVEMKYAGYLDTLLRSLLDKFSNCIDENENPGESCKSYLSVSQSVLRESKAVSTTAMFAFHAVLFQQANDKLTSRQIMRDTFDIFKKRTIVSLNKLDRRISNIEILMRKPWIGEPGVEIYGIKGYQVVEMKSPWCSKFHDGTNSQLNRASINSQAELDFISDLLGDREAFLGGQVNISSYPPSYSDFHWWDKSSTTFIHTLEKKVKGTGLLTARIKSGEICFGGPTPNLFVCEYS